jgi:hypothetical protein
VALPIHSSKGCDNVAHNIQFNNTETNKLENINDVDAAVCAHMGVACDPVTWCENWWNTVALGLAMGHTPDAIRGFLTEDIAREEPEQAAHLLRLVTILNFVTMTYDVITFRTMGFAV